MRMYDLIEKKRNSLPLSSAEIKFLVSGFTDGNIPDYQMAALLMAIVLNGMNEEETASLTEAMMHSGDCVDLSRYGNLSVDKHSTGGVGDKTTLILSPIVAALGGKMAKMSGRGLGHTGGTIDKLESIPGYRVALSLEEFSAQVDRVGVAVVSQSGNLAPADKKIYALRDVTATVDSIPLIASSIMSKKLAAGAHNIVLDVKIGSGAFMKTPAQAKALAEAMVSIAKAHGRKATALITNMDVPLGRAVGNSLEVIEAIEVLRGEGCEDLTKVCVALAAQLVRMCHGWSEEESLQKVKTVLADGSALEKFREWIVAQGGDPGCVEHPERLGIAKFSQEILAETDGYLAKMDTEQIGKTACVLGAGRTTAEEEIDPTAGLILHKKTGDFCCKGEPLVTLFSSDPKKISQGEKIFRSALTFSECPVEVLPLIFPDRIE